MAASDDGAARVRPGRLLTLVLSLGLTVTAAAASVLGGLSAGAAAASEPSRPGWVTAPVHAVVERALPAALDDGGYASGSAPGAVPRAQPRVESRAESGAEADQALERTPPRGSGTGRRVVFDESAQQVWLVREGGSVRSTYLVSGSVHDNLDPGRYAVYSRSRDAVGFDYSSTMDYMVRFTQGANAAIGFHDIPLDRQGEPMQRWSELGTPTSSGCVRQRPRDARELWRFASIGTPVVVVA